MFRKIGPDRAFALHQSTPEKPGGHSSKFVTRSSLNEPGQFYHLPAELYMDDVYPDFLPLMRYFGHKSRIDVPGNQFLAEKGN